jgi:acyl-CoA reductase-like NAD-dependent aldehyde dehydrogenase
LRARVAPISTGRYAVQRGFSTQSRVSAFERFTVVRRAADLLRSPIEDIAMPVTLEQGQAGADARRAAARGEGAGRTGRCLYLVEFPDRPGGSQDLGRPRGWVLGLPSSQRF